MKTHQKDPAAKLPWGLLLLYTGGKRKLRRNLVKKPLLI